MSQSHPQGTGSGQPRVIVALAEATGVDPERRQVLARAPAQGEIALPYDYLVLATGVEQSYFGHDEFASFAPGPTSLVDAERSGPSWYGPDYYRTAPERNPPGPSSGEHRCVKSLN